MLRNLSANYIYLFANAEVILGNNGGGGGTRDAGCLRYNFAATLNKTQVK